MTGTRTTVGLISDTHGLLRSSVHKALEGVDLILHAGDVGGSEILDELRIIAPVQAVYGNTDRTDDPILSQELIIPFGKIEIHVSHGHELGSPTPDKLLSAYPQAIIVYGHTHKALLVEADGRMVVNPGAAGPRRFNLEPSVARLFLNGDKPEVEIVTLD
jgi:phosphoesterase, MJ0936 family